MKSNTLILKTQQRFKSDRNNVFAEEINKIALSLNDDKRTQSINSIETYAYGTNKYLLNKKEEIKCNNIIKQYKNINFYDVAKENIKEHNPNWAQIPDHPSKILIIGGSGFEKTTSLFNLISQQPDIYKISLP